MALHETTKGLDIPIDGVPIHAIRGERELQDARDVHQPDELVPVLRDALSYGGPFFIEVISTPEHEVIPPVAPWERIAAGDENASG